MLERLTFERELQALAIAPPPVAAEIIGSDDRTPAFSTLQVPYRWICSLNFFLRNGQQWDEVSRGTGILIDANRVLTVAHALTVKQDGKPHPIGRIVVTPGRNGNQHPFGSAQAVRWKSAVGWDPKTERPFRADFAVLILDQALGMRRFKALRNQPLGWWGSAAHGHGTSLAPELSAERLEGQPVTCAGYPGDTCGTDRLGGATEAQKKQAIAKCRRAKPDLWASVPWWAGGMVTKIDRTGGMLHHTVDTDEGQSGAPVWIWYTKDGRKHRQLVGLHARPGTLQQVRDGPQTHKDNRAIQIRQSVLDEIRAFK